MAARAPAGAGTSLQPQREGHMIDEEISSLIEEAGYRFDPEVGRYQVFAGAGVDETDHSPEFIADELGIPLDDLERWQQEQSPAPDEPTPSQPE